jgi:flagellar FliJ protein
VPRRQLKTAQQLYENDERRKAEMLAASERQLQESEAKLTELKTYRADYQRDFARRAGAGMSAVAARDFQGFIARLDEAVRQQAELVMKARAQRAELLSKWRGAAQRSAVVDRVVERDKTDERRALERREQNESDERAQRAWTTEKQHRGR